MPYYVTSEWSIHSNTLSIKKTNNTPPMTDNNYMFNTKTPAQDCKDWIINYFSIHYHIPTTPTHYVAISKQGYFKTMYADDITNINTGNYHDYLCFDSLLSCNAFISQFLTYLRTEYHRLGGTNPLI